ncbi:hypothetical protein N7522_004249 [Penicillium canescens]|nr:hypothetical protein N7522_004249 [Penicillium canescens]
MSSVSIDHTDSETTLPPHKMSQSDRSSASLMCALPPEHVVRTFSRLKNLQIEAEKLLESLKKNGNGNQWIVVLNLSTRKIQKLDEEHDSSLGGIQYRFQWEGTTGLIKVVPSKAHDATTDKVTRVIDRKLDAMGLDWSDAAWVATATYKPTTSKGKQADQAFLPPARCPVGLPRSGWPTFVIETGVSESLNRLREDAKRWFVDSQGEVRIVMVISIKPAEVTFEKWQLAPNNAPRPLTRVYLDSLRAQSPNIPPLIPQPTPIQQPYSAQEVYVEPNRVIGAPLNIPFVALYDRSPGQGEGDILIQMQDFRNITKLLF